MKSWDEIAPKGTAAWCDAWRARYREMTYAEHQQAYDEILAAHPRQAGFDSGALTECLDRIGKRAVKIFEFGGWRGGLAADILKGEIGVLSWINVEITPLAQEEVECDDPRYSVYVPSDFIWNIMSDSRDVGNFFVSSHTIEHLTAEHLASLFRWLSSTVRYMFLQAPLPEDCTDNKWEGYGGTHILELGWKQIVNLLDSMGWALKWRGGIRNECLFFER